MSAFEIIPGEPDWLGNISVENRVAVARAIVTGFPVSDDV